MVPQHVKICLKQLSSIFELLGLKTWNHICGAFEFAWANLGKTKFSMGNTMVQDYCIILRLNGRATC